MTTTTIESGDLIAEIAPRGAELMRLTDRAGHELLWNGDPAWWTGRSPLLFPIVGRAPEDRILVDGKSYAMGKHGFARTRDFILTVHEPDRCAFRLVSDDETRAVFPFDFVLDVSYELSAARLTMRAEVRNESASPMPMQFGFHPAFRWPLGEQQARAEHHIVFEHAEPAGVRRLCDGLLYAQRFATPVSGNRLELKDDLFISDALIFDTLLSRSVRYGSASGPQIEIEFPDMPHLGIWTKPVAPYICIEPWQGTAALIGPPGELRGRPGAVLVAPRAARQFTMSVTLLDGAH